VPVTDVQESPLIRYSHPSYTTTDTHAEIPDIVTIFDSYIVNGSAQVIVAKVNGSGEVIVNNAAYCIAASAFILHEVPTLPAYPGKTSTVLKIISLTCKRSNPGLYVHINEASQATKGVAIDVPLR